MGIYDRYLAGRIRLADATLPKTVALVITERDLLTDDAFTTLREWFDWAFGYDAEQAVVYVSVLDEAAVPQLRSVLESLTAPRGMAVRTPGDDTPVDAPIQVSIGLGGQHEFATAVQSIATDIANSELSTDQITEAAIERRLVFPAVPDLVVKTGSERLSDFMVWQSAYSELYFTDVNWEQFRRRDYLRALRDYQTRQRRFGE